MSTQQVDLAAIAERVADDIRDDAHEQVNRCYQTWDEYRHPIAKQIVLDALTEALQGQQRSTLSPERREEIARQHADAAFGEVLRDHAYRAIGAAIDDVLREAGCG